MFTTPVHSKPLALPFSPSVDNDFQTPEGYRDLTRMYNEVQAAAPRMPVDEDFQSPLRNRITNHQVNTPTARADAENTPPCGKSAVSPKRVLERDLEGADSPPAAPIKSQKFKSRAGVAAAPFNPFKDQHQKLLNGEFNLMKVTFFAKGSYSNVYSIEGSDLLLKAFHGEKSGFHEPTLRKYLTHSAENYKAIQALGLPVAEITIKDGYILQRKIPHALDRNNPNQMEQVQAFFTASIQNNVPMDLQAQNFRVDNDGKVYLIDFLEETNENVEDEVNYQITSSLTTFSPDIAKFLTANASNWQSRSY